MLENVFNYMFLTVLIFLSLHAHGTSNKQVTLTYCYENKPVLPHFYGEGPLVPKSNPGPAIDILNQVATYHPDLIIKFVRYPWKRCLNDLASGKVDAVVGRYDPFREQIARYPKTSDGELDNSLSFSNSDSCLLHKAGSINWDGETLIFDKPMSMSVPNGYGVIGEMRKKGFDIYESPSINKAHELLFKGRVAVSLSNCHMEDVPTGFEQNTIPINQSIGYLMFSHQFFERQPLLANKLWQTLSEIDAEAFYQEYFNQALAH